MPFKKECHEYEKACFAYVMNNLEIDGGKTPLFAPVKTNVKNDGGRNPRFAPVNHRSSARTGVL